MACNKNNNNTAHFWGAESGEVAISYGIIAATMTVAIIVAIFAIGGDVNDMIAAVSFSR